MDRKRHRGGLLASIAAVALAAAVAVASRPPPAAGASPAGAELGRRGGRVVAALPTEPRTLNPAVAGDHPSRVVLQRLMGDLIRIDRASQETAPELAESWTVSDGGRRYRLALRRGVRFSDGHPLTADDVVFSFGVYLDPAVGSPQRELLVVGGEPIAVRRIDAHTVEFELAEPYAAAERLFDGFAILPRHLLAAAYARGELVRAWGLGSPPARIAGLGAFRLKAYRPGEHLILERNPHYWKRDRAGEPLPYLDELVFRFVPTQDAQILRFRAGELDVIDRLSAESFSLLARDRERRGYRLEDLGPGLDYNFLFFNLNDPPAQGAAGLARKQRWFRDVRFRRAVSAAVDRRAIVRLVYENRAAALATHVTPGNRRWLHAGLAPPGRDPERARRWLREAGFAWDGDGRLLDAAGERVGFTILTIGGASERTRMATVIEQDLEQLGIEVQVAPREVQEVLERLTQSRDYEACVLGLSGGDADPNPAIGVLASSGGHHFWDLGGSAGVEPWQAEVDRLMRRQLVTLDVAERKRLYDRVQEIVAEQLPLIGLVSPHVLVGARAGLGNFRPAVLDHQTLWNADELYWE